MNSRSSFCQSENLHQNLARHNLVRMTHNRPTDSWESDERCEFEYRVLEGHYIEELRYSVRSLIPREFTSIDDFVEWYELLCHPLQTHPLYKYVTNEADLTAMRWYLAQDIVARPSFTDLLAMTQTSLPLYVQMECARNYWDEMGRGNQASVHKGLLDRTVSSLGLRYSVESTVWESLAYSNSMIALANTRRYAYQSIGAMGMHELMMAWECSCISKGLKRLGMDQWVTSYFDLHAALNLSHGNSWVSHVVKPLVENDLNTLTWLAEGALIHLYCTRRCLARYSQEFGISNQLRDDLNWQHPVFEGLRLSA